MFTRDTDLGSIVSGFLTYMVPGYRQKGPLSTKPYILPFPLSDGRALWKWLSLSSSRETVLSHLALGCNPWKTTLPNVRRRNLKGGSKGRPWPCLHWRQCPRQWSYHPCHVTLHHTLGLCITRWKYKSWGKSLMAETGLTALSLLLGAGVGVGCILAFFGLCISPRLTQWGFLPVERGLCSQQMTDIHYYLPFWLPLFVLLHILTFIRALTQQNVAILLITYNVLLPSPTGENPK